MQKQDHSSHPTGDGVDIETGSLAKLDRLLTAEEEEEEEEEERPAVARVRISYQPLTMPRGPAAAGRWLEPPPPVDAAVLLADRDSLAGLIAPWLRLWSRLCLLGVLQCPGSGWGRLPWFLLRLLLAVTLMIQAVTSVSTLLSLPRGAAFFVSLQACEHFSLLSLLLPALSLRAAAFRRSLTLMEHVQTLPVFSDISLAAPRRRILGVLAVACLVFLGLQALHVAGGLITVDFQQSQGLNGTLFTLFPPIMSSTNIMVHYAILLLQFVHVFGVYAANVLSVTSLHCINIFLYYHLCHLSNTVRTLLDRKRATSGGVSGKAWNATDNRRPPDTQQKATRRPPDTSCWTEVLEAHSSLWRLHGELQKSFSECGVVTHLAGLLDMCLTSYICIKAYWQYSLNWMVLLVAAGYMMFSGLCILLESVSTDCVHSANAAIFDSNYGPSLAGLQSREMDMVRLILLKSREPMQLNVMNMFGITMSSFGSVLSLTVTYLIIIIQFDG